MLLLSAVFVLAQNPDIDGFIASQMAAQHIPGLSLAVLSGGKVVKEGCYGQADLATGTKVLPESVFNIGSLSKAVIASAVMTLAAEGRLSLDAPLSTFFEGAPEFWTKIRVRDALSHTGGLARELSGYSYLRPLSPDDIVKMAMATPPLAEPRERYAYSNVAYFILGEIVSKVSGAPYPRYVETKLFKPLGMATACLTSAVVSNRALGYGWKEEKFVPSLVMKNVRTSGAFAGSIRDMELWAGEMLRPHVLSAEILRQMWTPVTLRDGKTSNYGFGWVVGSKGDIRHNGAQPGYRSGMILYPKENVAVVVLTNSDDANADRLAQGVADLVRGPS